MPATLATKSNLHSQRNSQLSKANKDLIKPLKLVIENLNNRSNENLDLTLTEADLKVDKKLKKHAIFDLQTKLLPSEFAESTQTNNLGVVAQDLTGGGNSLPMIQAGKFSYA